MGSPLRIAIGGRKGGVGKTALTVSIAGDLANRHGLTVLALDVDPQANMTAWFGLPKADGDDDTSMNDVIYSAATDGALNAAIVECPWDGGIWVARSEEQLASRETDNVSSKHLRIRRLLRTADLSWVDVVLMDCPPSLGGLFEMCLNAADKFVVVSDSERGGLDGVASALDVAAVIAEDANPSLEVAAIAMNQFDMRKNEHKARWEELEELYGSAYKLFKLPDRTAVATAFGASIPPNAVKGAAPFVWALRDVVDHLVAERGDDQ